MGTRRLATDPVIRAREKAISVRRHFKRNGRAKGRRKRPGGRRISAVAIQNDAPLREESLKNTTTTTATTKKRRRWTRISKIKTEMNSSDLVSFLFFLGGGGQNSVALGHRNSSTGSSISFDSMIERICVSIATRLMCRRATAAFQSSHHAKHGQNTHTHTHTHTHTQKRTRWSPWKQHFKISRPLLSSLLLLLLLLSSCSEGTRHGARFAASPRLPPDSRTRFPPQKKKERKNPVEPDPERTSCVVYPKDGVAGGRALGRRGDPDAAIGRRFERVQPLLGFILQQ